MAQPWKRLDRCVGFEYEQLVMETSSNSASGSWAISRIAPLAVLASLLRPTDAALIIKSFHSLILHLLDHSQSTVLTGPWTLIASLAVPLLMCKDRARKIHLAVKSHTTAPCRYAEMMSNFEASLTEPSIRWLSVLDAGPSARRGQNDDSFLFGPIVNCALTTKWLSSAVIDLLLETHLSRCR